MENTRDALETAPVHTSLQRRPTMGGLPQDAFLLLALIMITMGLLHAWTQKSWQDAAWHILSCCHCFGGYSKKTHSSWLWCRGL